MNELSLFSGAGGGLLASKLLGFRAVGYVENDPFCQEIIHARIRDSIFDSAPIFGDIKAFLRSGSAERYRGVVDLVSGGFPCQPFSVAGKRAGSADDRNLWPETIEVVRRVKPWCVFLENVPGLIASGYFGTVLGQLAENGFDATWTVLGADNVGASHRRKRLWILALANNNSWRCQIERLSGLFDSLWAPQRYDIDGCRCEAVADSNADIPSLFPPGPNNLQAWRRVQEALEPSVCGVAHGMARRVDRLRALGNGQVPLVAATAFCLLTQRFAEACR